MKSKTKYSICLSTINGVVRPDCVDTKGQAVRYIEQWSKEEQEKAFIEKVENGKVVEIYTPDKFRDKYEMSYDPDTEMVHEKGVYLYVFYGKNGIVVTGMHGSVNVSDGWNMVNNAYRRKPAPKSEYVLEQFEFTYPAAWAPYEVRKNFEKGVQIESEV